MTALAIRHKQTILQQLASGKLLKEIAAQFGISKQSIQRPLVNDPDYQAALIEQADSLVDEAKIETWAAREPADIARAREIARFAFRYAESMNPSKWSPKSEVTVHTVDLGDRLRRAKERIIEAEPATIVAEQQALPKPK